MPPNVAGPAGERILAGFRGRRHRFGRREVALRIEGPQLQASAIHLLHPIDRDTESRAKVLRRQLRVALESRDRLVQPLAQRDDQIGRAKRIALRPPTLAISSVGAVSDIVHVEVE